MVAENFDWVHTIDKLKTARRLSGTATESLGPLNVCLQVNVDDEDSKAGVAPASVPELGRRLCRSAESQFARADVPAG